MKEKSKVILGYWKNNRLYLSNHEKQIIIDDYLSGDESRQSVYERYTGYPEEHGIIVRWMAQLGIEDKSLKKPNFVNMSKQNKENSQESEDFEY